jgi:hypothetical protein
MSGQGVALELPTLHLPALVPQGGLAAANASLQQPDSQAVSDVLNAASSGDLYKITRFGAQYNLDVGDYDKRTAMHLAAGQGSNPQTLNPITH